LRRQIGGRARKTESAHVVTVLLSRFCAALQPTDGLALLSGPPGVASRLEAA
jgi:hypothetical protein